MIGYVTVGADDIPLAERFYSAFLPSLGYNLEISPEGLSYSIPSTSDQWPQPADFYVKPPYDGQPASSGNGTMVAFEVKTQAMVRELHAAALAAGGRDEGGPGFRAEYSAHFYVGYLRDPQGNKIALVCNNRDEPKRPD
ncbi:lactoylglutathione lyase-like lyase [Hoeflea sp. IMCC20628]|uniref:VOC family protein n=1 Tax=Hoeflea sp. IMCC20628 TaxID=1620421 RepID=UPI00063A9885|nr:VOC family protein [Hoeflea sp. IMCC20628]AKH99491.1 lactoylglutathione lyase-like lyase [Hoeflea sp. IMCC20628]